MEVRATRQMRRNEQLDKLLSKRPGTAEAVPGARTSQQQSSDRCSVSRQALAYLERQNMVRQALDERRAAQESRIRAYLDDMENREKQLELLRRAMETMKKCMKIAASIMKGNKVPPEDLKYLMKNDPEGYRLAMAMRRENPDPKKEKSVLNDENRKGDTAVSIDCVRGSAAHKIPSGSGDAPSLE